MREASKLYLVDLKLRVPVVAVFCLDYRFVQQHQDFLRHELGILFYTPYTFPSGPRVYTDRETRNVFLGAFSRVSDHHHQATRVILIAHRDCKAWGGSEAFPSLEAERAAHEDDMRAARDTLQRRCPRLEIELYYMEIVSRTGDEGKIQFQPVR
ncbi:MAG: carbonic anhydrase [Patescibacteria group bacterium]